VAELGVTRIGCNIERRMVGCGVREEKLGRIGWSLESGANSRIGGGSKSRIGRGNQGEIRGWNEQTTNTNNMNRHRTIMNQE
jgi:hypothetical protein